METTRTFESITDWIVTLGMVGILIVIYGGWLVSYRTPKNAPVGSSLWFRLPNWAQIIAGFLITALGAYIGYLLWIPLPLSLAPFLALVLRVVGLLLLLAGAIFFLWGRHTLGTQYATSTSSAVQLPADHRLIQHGPFALVRHPIYLGYWFLLAGVFVIYRTLTPLVFILLMVASLSRRARREDIALEATFGDEWRRYAARVPMFVPRWRR